MDEDISECYLGLCCDSTQHPVADISDYCKLDHKVDESNKHNNGMTQHVNIPPSKLIVYTEILIATLLILYHCLFKIRIKMTVRLKDANAMTFECCMVINLSYLFEKLISPFFSLEFVKRALNFCIV